MKNIQNFKEKRKELDQKMNFDDRTVNLQELWTNQIIIISKLEMMESLLYRLFKHNNITILDGDGNEISFSDYCTLMFDQSFISQLQTKGKPWDVPFNLASMSLLLRLFAMVLNMIPGISTWIGGDTHLYVDHIDGVKEQIKREAFKLPKLKINKELKSLEDILSLTIDDFELIGYESYEKIKAKLHTGYKK